MATLTAIHRDNRPAKYIRKDARTAIYKALYSKSEATLFKGKRPNVPENDFSRRLPYHWEWQKAVAVWKANVEAAAFTPKRKAELEAHLDSLKHRKENINIEA